MLLKLLWSIIYILFFPHRYFVAGKFSSQREYAGIQQPMTTHFALLIVYFSSLPLSHAHSQCKCKYSKYNWNFEEDFKVLEISFETRSLIMNRTESWRTYVHINFFRRKNIFDLFYDHAKNKLRKQTFLKVFDINYVQHFHFPPNEAQ